MDMLHVPDSLKKAKPERPSAFSQLIGSMLPVMITWCGVIPVSFFLLLRTQGHEVEDLLGHTKLLLKSGVVVVCSLTIVRGLQGFFKGYQASRAVK